MGVSLLYKDIMSVMLLETNRKASSLKCTKHIKVNFFIMKDAVHQGEIDHHRTLSSQTDVDRHQHQTKARLGLSCAQGICHGHPCGLQRCRLRRLGVFIAKTESVDTTFNSLTAKGGHDRPLFDKLLW